MPSRDSQASYYDIDLPDGHRTEVWSILRAVLTPEEALGYVKGCILTRLMRDGKKPGVGRVREAEKVAHEAGMLREAMDAYMATPDPRVAALDAVDSHDPRECVDRIAELENARDVVLSESRGLRAQHEEACKRIAELERKKDALHKALGGERAVWAALPNDVLQDEELTAADCVEALRESRDEAREDAMKAKRLCNELFDACQTEQAALKATIAAHRAFSNGLSHKLAALTDRYRPRKQSEEPAASGVGVFVWSGINRWVFRWGHDVAESETWTHQPPPPDA